MLNRGLWQFDLQAVHAGIKIASISIIRQT